MTDRPRAGRSLRRRAGRPRRGQYSRSSRVDSRCGRTWAVWAHITVHVERNVRHNSWPSSPPRPPTPRSCGWPRTCSLTRPSGPPPGDAPGPPPCSGEPRTLRPDPPRRRFRAGFDGRRPAPRREAPRRHPRQPRRGHLHRRRLGRRVGLRQPRRPAFTIAIPALLAEIPRLLHDTPATWTSDEFPFVLRPESDARSPPTPSSATPAGATPRARCGEPHRRRSPRHRRDGPGRAPPRTAPPRPESRSPT